MRIEISSLLFIVSLLITANGECCLKYGKATFVIEDASCEAVGGSSSGDPQVCSISFCADGTKIEGYYCGYGECNILGCNCDGGCREGDWLNSFLKRNANYKIKIRPENIGYFDLDRDLPSVIW